MWALLEKGKMSIEKIEENTQRIDELFKIIERICPHPEKERRYSDNKNTYYCYVCNNWIKVGAK